MRLATASLNGWMPLMLAVAVALSGCAADRESRPADASAVPPAAPPGLAVPPDPGPLPPPEALTDVLYRLADPAVPGNGKLGLVAGATTSDAAALDGFAAALRDGGFAPLTVSAADLGWADTAGDVRAVVTMSGPQPSDEFRFPLEFHPHDGGWQLSRETADLLLTATP